MFFFLNFMIIFTIMIIMMMINYFMYKKKFYNREKLSPFECGFPIMNNKIPSKMPFSLQFYFISLLFLIFDVEITIIMPIILTQHTNFINKYMLTSMLMIMILIIGIYLEWFNNMIKWF